MAGRGKKPPSHEAVHARRRRSDAGFALLLVLWTLAFLALIGTQTLTLGHAALDLESATLWKTRLRTAADAAITTTLFSLAVPDPQRNADAANGIGIGIRVRTRMDADRLNPNIASQPLLSAFLATQKIPPAQAAALAALIYAWHNAGFQPPGGACRSLGAPFHDLDDLSVIPGMNADILARLSPHLSFAQRQLPAPGTRDPTIREALTRSGISGGADQENPADASSAPHLVIIDVTATHGTFRILRHAEALLAPGLRPVPWRLMRVETTSDPAEDMEPPRPSGIADHP